MANRQRAEELSAYLNEIRKADLKKPPSHKRHESLFGRLIPNVVEKGARQITQDLINTIPGLYYTGKGVTEDAFALGEKTRKAIDPSVKNTDLPAFARGPIGKNTRGFAKGSAKRLVEDVEHPGRNPGHLLVDVATLYAPIVGRGAEAGRVFSAARKGGPGPAAGRLPSPIPSSPVKGGGRGARARAGSSKRTAAAAGQANAPGRVPLPNKAIQAEEARTIAQAGPYQVPELVRVPPNTENVRLVTKHVQRAGKRFGVVEITRGPDLGKYRVAKIDENGAVETLHGPLFDKIQGAAKALIITSKEHHFGKPYRLDNPERAAELARRVNEPKPLVPEAGSQEHIEAMRRQGKGGSGGGAFPVTKPRTHAPEKVVQAEAIGRVDPKNLERFVLGVKASPKMMKQLNEEGVKEGDIEIQVSSGGMARVTKGHKILAAAIRASKVKEVPVRIVHMKGKDRHATHRLDPRERAKMLTQKASTLSDHPQGRMISKPGEDTPRVAIPADLAAIASGESKTIDHPAETRQGPPDSQGPRTQDVIQAEIDDMRQGLHKAMDENNEPAIDALSAHIDDLVQEHAAAEPAPKAETPKPAPKPEPKVVEKKVVEKPKPEGPRKKVYTIKNTVKYGEGVEWRRQVKASTPEGALAWAQKQGAPADVEVFQVGKNVTPGHPEFKFKIKDSAGKVRSVKIKAKTLEDAKASISNLGYQKIEHIASVAADATKEEKTAAAKAGKENAKKVAAEEKKSKAVAQPTVEKAKAQPVFPIAHDLNGKTVTAFVSAADEAAALKAAKAAKLKNPRVALEEEVLKPEAKASGKVRRGTGLSSRELGVNPRKLTAAQVAKEFHGDIQKKMVAVHLAAAESGLEHPKVSAMRDVFADVLGPQDGAEAFARWFKIQGAAGAPFNVALAAAFHELIHPTRGGTIDLGAAAFKKHGVKQNIPIEIPVSTSPWVRQFQYVRYGLMKEFNPTARQKILQHIFRATPRKLRAKVKREIQIIERWRDDVEKSGKLMTRAQVRQMQRDAFRKKNKDLIDYLDTGQQMAVMLTLHLKPAYFGPNFAGQVIMMAADHAWNPFSIGRSSKLAHDFYKKYPKMTTQVRAAMQHGMAESLLDASRPMPGASYRISRVTSTVANLYSKVLDTPFRDNAFFHEAIRQGFSSPDAVHMLMTDPRLSGKFFEISRRANKNIVDYSLYSKFEQNVVRRVIFFYPWISGASKYSARFFTEHPIQGQLATQMARDAQDRIEKELGPVPSYLEGSFVVGHRNVRGLGREPLVVNPTSLTILGTLGQTMELVQGNVTGTAAPSELPAEFLTPPLSALIAGWTHQDPFTQHTYPQSMPFQDVVAKKLATNIAPLEALKRVQRAKDFETGKASTKRVLYPYSVSEALLRYGVGGTPFALNKAESQSRAFSEKKGLLPATQREVLKNQRYIQQYRDASKKVGLKLPYVVEQAFILRGEHAANSAAWEDRLGRRLNVGDRVLADMSFLVQRKMIDEKRAKGLLKQWAKLPESSLQKVDTLLVSQYIGTPAIGQYKKILNERLEAAGEDRITSP